MMYYWILIVSWFGSASLQYINSASPDAGTLLDPSDSSNHYLPLPYVNYFNYPARNYELQSNDEHSQLFEPDAIDSLRKRRTAKENEFENDKRWKPFVDNDKTFYVRSDAKASPFIIDASSGENNSSDGEILGAVEKRSFSPWGGKRDKPDVTAEHMWTWKRSAAVREPSMPKRVRFSPWGGKRSGQMVYKPGTKGSKIIFSASIPELTRIISNYIPTTRADEAGFQFVPSQDKRHPIKILALSANVEDRILRDALPYNTFMENLPKMYKPGHTYSDVNLKKDGKRKVKFSAWGGKRSPPIIGPIWIPASEDVKDSTLNTIVLVRNNQNEYDPKSL